MDVAKKILIVDDDSFLLDMYSLKFVKSNFNVMTALRPETALDKLREGFDPDIILLDIMMPGIDGFELFEKIKKENLASSAVVVFLSNRGLPSDVFKAEQLGAAGYIVKATSTPSEVIDKVVKIIKDSK